MSGALGFSIVYILLLLIPGFAGFKTLMYKWRRVDGYSRFDKLSYVIGMGLLSLFLFLAGHWHTTTTLVSPANFDQLPALYILSGAIIQAIIAGTAGWLIGGLLYWQDGTRHYTDYDQPWEKVDQKIRQKRVYVVLQNGDSLTGRVFRFGSGAKAGDLYLTNPERITPDGGPIDVEANAAYVSKNDISQVFFADDEYDVDEVQPPGTETATLSERGRTVLRESLSWWP